MGLWAFGPNFLNTNPTKNLDGLRLDLLVLTAQQVIFNSKVFMNWSGPRHDVLDAGLYPDININKY